MFICNYNIIVYAVICIYFLICKVYYDKNLFYIFHNFFLLSILLLKKLQYKINFCVEKFNI